ncbi:MAG: Holliday junction resolvase RuvX [Candidatus Babeliales bacterium]
MRYLCLDIGDVWTGIAIGTDESLLAFPLTTAQTVQLKTVLPTLIREEQIHTLVVGQPKTMKGSTGIQEEKTRRCVETLRPLITNVQWVWWDERLSTKQAKTYVTLSKKDKHAVHARAAVMILESYLSYIKQHNASSS